MSILKNIDAAKGIIPADILLKNVRLINVFSNEIEKTDIAVKGTKIVGIGSGYSAKEEINLKGQYAAPGFIDSHLHVESSMVSLAEYSKIVVPKGTTTIIIDPHEIANTMGLAGITYMLENAKRLPLGVFFMLPSCVPATNMETSGARISASDMSVVISSKWILGLGEMMNYPGVINRDPEVMEKVLLAHKHDMIIDGHAPGLSGNDLNAYITAGIVSDHECTTRKEALEKLRRGMYIMIREGTTEKNLDELITIVNSGNARRFLFATDDRHPADLIDEGHIDYLIKKSIQKKINPVNAFQIASLNAAEHFGIQRVGAIVPGFLADIVIFNNLTDLKIKKVFKAGKLVAENGQVTVKIAKHRSSVLRSSINIKWIEKDDLKIKAKSEKIKVIGTVPDQIITKKIIEKVKITNGYAVSDTDNDILKVVVIERHLSSGNIGKGFVKGFGFKKGAIASSISHDSHNLIAVGTDDEDIFKAIKQVIKINGGCVVVSERETLASLELPIAGLMSIKDIKTVRKEQDNLNRAAKKIGSIQSDPFMILSFLALPVIPELKITDKGLFDVALFKHVPLFE